MAARLMDLTLFELIALSLELTLLRPEFLRD
jgi:hypothetical protein